MSIIFTNPVNDLDSSPLFVLHKAISKAPSPSIMLRTRLASLTQLWHGSIGSRAVPTLGCRGRSRSRLELAVLRGSFLSEQAIFWESVTLLRRKSQSYFRGPAFEMSGICAGCRYADKKSILPCTGRRLGSAMLSGWRLFSTSSLL